MITRLWFFVVTGPKTCVANVCVCFVNQLTCPGVGRTERTMGQRSVSLKFNGPFLKFMGH